MSLVVKLYDKNLAAPTFVEDMTKRQENLSFSTLLHGGFGICTFDLVCNLAEVWEWRLGRFFWRLVIEEAESGESIWEGRLEDQEFLKYGVRLTFYGYWRNLADDIYNNTTSWTSGTHYADEIIKDMLTTKCPQIAADQSHIASPGRNLVPIEFDKDKTPKEIVRQLSEYSDAGDLPWYFAIWEDRIPYYTARNPSAVDWQIWLRDIETFHLRATARELWNYVYAIYNAAGTKTRTADSSNTVSEVKYIKRRRGIDLTARGNLAAGVAQGARNMELSERREVQQETDRFVVTTKVQDAQGVEKQLYHVRAGDTIRIADLVPATASLGTVSLDALRTFYILETQYDAARHRLTLIPDRQSQRLDAIIARML